MKRHRYRRCASPDCEKQAIFSLSPTERAEWCGLHLQHPGRLDVKSKKCEACRKQALFNWKGLLGGRWCKDHAPADTINVKAVRCVQCGVGALFGWPGSRPSVCAQHRVAGMMCYPRRRCIHCSRLALFGRRAVPRHCDLHRQPEDFCVIVRHCLQCHSLGFTDVLQRCSSCSDYLCTKVFLRQQRKVWHWLSSSGLPAWECYDQRVGGGKERPDFMWEAGSHKILLEVDEGQHKDRRHETEIQRMITITQNLQRPCLWLRYNPDHFTASRPWSEEQRRAVLLHWLQQGLMGQTPRAPLVVWYLCFDGFEGEPREEIIPMTARE